MKNKEKIVFVVQRYGDNVVGGSESECRMYAERLTPYYDVEVVTTCAVDYISWANVFEPGVSELNGVTVRRFPVTRERELGEFTRVSEVVREKGSRCSKEELREWLEIQGPCAPEALEYLEEHQSEYKAMLFMTYLYYLTAVGAPRFPGKSILVPTAHDEWPIYLDCFRAQFEAAGGIVYTARRSAGSRIGCFWRPSASRGSPSARAWSTPGESCRTSGSASASPTPIFCTADGWREPRAATSSSSTSTPTSGASMTISSWSLPERWR